MIVGRISHQVRRFFSFLNFSDGFEKKPAQGDDRFVARSEMLPGPVIDAPMLAVAHASCSETLTASMPEKLTVFCKVRFCRYCEGI
jgi:hypothetical protein